MRKGNLMILASILTIFLVAVAVGAGTMAWFSDDETSSIGQITTGTKDLKVKLGDDTPPIGGFSDGITIPGPQNWDDEDEFTFVIWFKNVGTAGAVYLYREYTGFSGVEGFKDAVEIVSMQEYYASAWDSTNWVMGSSDGTTWSTWGWDHTAPGSDQNQQFTLRELLDMKPGQYDEKCYDYASAQLPEGDGNPTLDYLPPGGMVAAKYTIKLMGSETTNTLQGASFSFSILAHMTNEDIGTYAGPDPGP